MPTNIEIKARVATLRRYGAAIEPLADGPAETLDQEDIFFAAPDGRLKLRTFGDQHGELIHYHRSDIAGPKTSHYTIAPTSDPVALRAILTSILGVVGVVRKRRWLYWRPDPCPPRPGGGPGRIRRAGGRDLRPDQAEDEGIAMAEDLMARLGIAEGQLVDVAYIDLMGGGP